MSRRYESVWEPGAGFRLVRIRGRWVLPDDAPIAGKDPTFEHEPCTTIYDMRELTVDAGLSDIDYTVRELHDHVSGLSERHAYWVKDASAGVIFTMIASQREQNPPAKWFLEFEKVLAFTGITEEQYRAAEGRLELRYED